MTDTTETEPTTADISYPSTGGYRRVPTRGGVSANAHYLEFVTLMPSSPSSGVAVDTIHHKLMVVDKLLMEFVHDSADTTRKYGKWSATYLSDSTEAFARFNERVAQLQPEDANVTTRTLFIAEFQIQLAERDIQELTEQNKRGIHARFRASQWVETHCGKLTTVGGEVSLQPR